LTLAGNATGFTITKGLQPEHSIIMLKKLVLLLLAFAFVRVAMGQAGRDRTPRRGNSVSSAPGQQAASSAGSGPNGGMVNAADYHTGPTWAEWVNNAVAALPATGGIVNAEGLCKSAPLHAADANVILGSMKQPVKILLGPCTYPLGAYSIQYFYLTEIDGVWGSTKITNTTGAAFISGNSHPSSYISAAIRDVAVAGNRSAGSVGLDLTYSIGGNYENITISSEDLPLTLGGTRWCACYNQFRNITAFGLSYGFRFLRNANLNYAYGLGGRAGANGTAYHIAAGTNLFFGSDMESTAARGEKSVEISGTGNIFWGAYYEQSGGVQFDHGATGNKILCLNICESKVTDNSGNHTNEYKSLTPGASGVYGPSSKYLASQDGICFGPDLRCTGNNGGALLVHGGSNYANNPLLDLAYSGRNESTYRRIGHAWLALGEVSTTQGARFQGRTTVSPLPNPPAPALSVGGTAGRDLDNYALVCNDNNGGSTLPGSFARINNAPAVLDSANYVQLSWRWQDGCVSYTVLKQDQEHVIATIAPSGRLPSGFACTMPVPPVGQPLNLDPVMCKDEGAALRAYAAPVRNTTGDAAIAGQISLGGTRATWTSGSGAPKSSCMTGSLYTNTNGGTGSTLYACEAGAWAAK